MKSLLLPSLAVVVTSVTFAGLAHGQAGDLAGVWSHRGAQTELVMQPRIRLQPYASPSYGTNYGGSVGYGSVTTTNVVTEAAPVRVSRVMTLTIQASGAAEWRIERRQPAGADCTQTIRQTKTGRVTTGSGQMTFHLQGGSERTESTCGAPSERVIAAGTETYSMRRDARALSLTSGGATWTFNRG